jgi:predicted nucleic acid-binding protein
MMLADSSAWVEFIRGTGSRAEQLLVTAIRADDVATTDTVRMELLAGSFRGLSTEDVEAMLDRCSELHQLPREDVSRASEIYRGCRLAGYTVRALNDCLIAAVAIRHSVPVLHCDRDFDVIAKFTDLQVVQA